MLCLAVVLSLINIIEAQNIESTSNKRWSTTYAKTFDNATKVILHYEGMDDEGGNNPFLGTTSLMDPWNGQRGHFDVSAIGNGYDDVWESIMEMANADLVSTATYIKKFDNGTLVVLHYEITSSGGAGGGSDDDPFKDFTRDDPWGSDGGVVESSFSKHGNDDLWVHIKETWSSDYAAYDEQTTAETTTIATTVVSNTTNNVVIISNSNAVLISNKGSISQPVDRPIIAGLLTIAFSSVFFSFSCSVTVEEL